VAQKKILVIFGSKSDSKIYDVLCSMLDDAGKQYSLKICSAHKSPALLDPILHEGDFDIVVAGAGLAAHLPGVVASKTIKPVIGIPCTGNYDGLDALLSVAQMPGGIPVLSTGINGKGFETLVNSKDSYDKVNIIGMQDHKACKKCVEMLKQFGVLHTESEWPVSDAVNINFLSLEGGTVADTGHFVINVPLKQDSSAEDTLKLLRLMQAGLWVGLGRGENAALAAVEVINHDGKYSQALSEYRDVLSAKFKEII
jgi:5-(carboxyamino)imidazole ribonucleotide mutase